MSSSADTAASSVQALSDQYLPAADPPQLLPTIQRVTRAGGESSFTKAFQSAIMGPSPAWFSNLSAPYQSQLTKMQAGMASLRDQVVANATSEPHSTAESSSALSAFSNLFATPTLSPTTNIYKGTGTSSGTGARQRLQRALKGILFLHGR